MDTFLVPIVSANWRENFNIYLSLNSSGTYISVAHVSNRLRLFFFLLSFFLLKMVSVMNELYCHKKNHHLFRKCSTELYVFLKVLLKILQISLENTCAR